MLHGKEKARERIFTLKDMGGGGGWRRVIPLIVFVSSKGYQTSLKENFISVLIEGSNNYPLKAKGAAETHTPQTLLF